MAARGKHNNHFKTRWEFKSPSGETVITSDLEMDISNFWYGPYQIIERVSSKKPNGHRHYKYKCLCGNVRIRSIFDIIRRAKVQHCRCHQYRTSADICSDQIYQLYRYSANRRKKGYQNQVYREIEFSLTREEFFPMLVSNCYYCNKAPASKKTVNKKHTLLYNGIDRLNNDIGYIKSNCVPCCWECNQAKRARSYSEFSNWVLSVYQNLKNNGAFNVPY